MQTRYADLLQTFNKLQTDLETKNSEVTSLLASVEERKAHEAALTLAIQDSETKCQALSDEVSGLLFDGHLLAALTNVTVVRVALEDVVVFARSQSFSSLHQCKTQRELRVSLHSCAERRLIEGSRNPGRGCTTPRITFGVVSSPFLLSATIAHHLNKGDNKWSKDILRNTYVDNVIMGTNSECDATEYYHHAKSIFSTASMNLREWSANSEDVRNSIPPPDCSSEKKEILISAISSQALPQQ